MSNHADFKVKHGLVVNTTASFLSTVTSASTTTGGVILSGGAGIAKDVYIGGLLNVGSPGSGVITASGNISLTSTGGSVIVTTSTNATSTTTGAFQVVGGAGIQGDLYARNIYSNGILIGTNAGSATTSTNLNGGEAGYVPYQLAPSVTTLTNKLVYDNLFLNVNSATVLTTASVFGQVGISVATTSTGNVYLAFIPGAQGLTADFGLISDQTGPVYYDWGALA